MLFVIGQRYKFESNSQHVARRVFDAILLFVIGQRYKFESNSQHFTYIVEIYCVVCHRTKIQI